jgi:hypothetical protein
MNYKELRVELNKQKYKRINLFMIKTQYHLIFSNGINV